MTRQRTEWTELVQVRLSPAMKALAVTYATDSGSELATWIRGLIAEKIGWAEREQRRRLAGRKEPK